MMNYDRRQIPRPVPVTTLSSSYVGRRRQHLVGRRWKTHRPCLSETRRLVPRRSSLQLSFSRRTACMHCESAQVPISNAHLYFNTHSQQNIIRFGLVGFCLNIARGVINTTGNHFITFLKFWTRPLHYELHCVLISPGMLMSRIFCQNVLSVFTAFGIYLRLDYRHAILFIFIVQLSDLFWSMRVLFGILDCLTNCRKILNVLILNVL